MSTSFDYASRQRHPRRHLLALALVLGLHVLLWWAIQSGLARKVVHETQHKVVAMLLSDTPPPLPQPPSPPTPPPRTPPPPQTVAPPALPVTTPLPNSITTPAAAISSNAAATAPAPTAAPSLRVGAVIQPGANCPKPQYPSASRRLEEEGTVTLRFLIGLDGNVLQAEIEKSSGYSRLDEAARLALSKCQFRPGSVDGKPEQSWASIKYTWRLE